MLSPSFRRTYRYIFRLLFLNTEFLEEISEILFRLLHQLLEGDVS